MKENAEDPNAKHPIARWRVVVATAAVVAVGAVASGVRIDAGAALQSEVEMLRAASWVIATFAFVWFCVVAMMGGGRRTSTPFELRMIFERNSRMPYAANAHSTRARARRCPNTHADHSLHAKGRPNVEENGAQAYARHDVNRWRVVVVAAPLVAVAAPAGGLNVEADAELGLVALVLTTIGSGMKGNSLEVNMTLAVGGTILGAIATMVVALGVSGKARACGLTLAMSGLVTVLIALQMTPPDVEDNSSPAWVIRAQVAHDTTTNVKIDGDRVTSLRSSDAQVELGRSEGIDTENTVRVFADGTGTIHAQAGRQVEHRTYDVEARTANGNTYLG